MASNRDTNILNRVFGPQAFPGAPDWIEIRNVSGAPVNLLNWSLSDKSGDPGLWRFPETNLNAGAYMVIAASGMNRRVPGAPLHTSFNLASDGEFLGLFDPDGQLASAFGSKYPPQATNVAYGFPILSPNLLLIATNTAPLRYQIPTGSAGGTDWTFAGFNDAAWTQGTNGVGYGPGISGLFKTDLRAMSNVNASAYVRIPFTIDNPTNVTLLTLRLRYDDGFVAWINGVEVVRANAPDPVAWNSAATAAHAPGTPEEFRLGAGMLVAGNNVLAIQGLNLSTTDADFLVQAELNATYLERDETNATYLALASPGSANSGPSSRGPLVTEVSHTPNVPTEDQDLWVTAQVTPTFNPVSTVTLVYRFMFLAETNTPMFDDGAHHDGLANDGVYGALLPAAAGTTNGQMIRYFVRATDSAGVNGRFPTFLNAASTEYLGTIVEPIGLESKLPIVHLFAPPTVLGPGPTTSQTGADSQAGARVSLFHDGEFYDNIHMQLRGNTTANYNKKSHRLEFNPDHPFRHNGPGPRLRKTSFVADYPDPTFMRQGLSFWLCDLMGSPAPFYIPHRLQLNGAFYQLANHNDVHGEELLERLGFDPNGALYNAAGMVTPGKASTGGFEKKTRRWENDLDYTNMSVAIGEGNTLSRRETNFFDLFDIPNALNYLVSARWFHENDDVWANMSLYHDNDGDDLWRIIAFDVNLSWGAIYYEGGVPSVIEGVQATNDIHKAHPLYGSQVTPALNSGNYNRVYDTVFQVPVLREMFLRRLRTLLDTYAQPPESHPLSRTFENKIKAWRDLILDEANRDRAKWGWPAKGGQCNFDPGILPLPGIDAMINEFVVKRRIHFYVKHSITNANPVSFPVGITKTNNAGIPLPQPADATIRVHAIEFNPASGNQAQEYIVLTNPQPYAVDISDWKLSGGVDFTFHKGTVIPANRAAYLSPNVRAFRARTTGPRGGQGLFVIGPYSGQLSARGEGLAIHDPTGRLVHTNSYTGSPSLAQRYLRVTEIMYNPAAPAGSPTDPQEFEYIELKNISGTETLSLNGVRFAEGISFNFTGSAVTSLPPGGRVLVVKNPSAFAAKYGAGIPGIAGQYTGSLDSNGERLRLLDSSNEEILDFSYNNSWYPVTDGLGFSLVVNDEGAEPDAWSTKAQWRASGSTTGSPGGSDPAPPAFAPIVISELFTHSDPPLQDYIELHNPSTNDANIGGWYLSDDFTNALKYRIPDGTILPAGGYLAFTEAQFNPTPGVPPSFSFSSRGDDAYVFSAGAPGQLTGYISGYEVGAAATGVAFGRYTNSVGDVHFVAQSTRTPNAPNSGPKVGPVVISEIHYHPADNADGSDNSTDEFIELRNTTLASIPLYDPAAPANRWRLRGDVDFDFPAGLSIEPGDHLIVANLDPTDPAALSAFRARFSVPPLVPIVGPYQGKLDNSGGSVRLYRPDSPVFELPAQVPFVPYVLEDEVDYRDASPWNDLADGTGASLQRIDALSYGNDPINWTAAAPTAGSILTPGSAPTILTQPADVAGIASQSALLSVSASGSDLKYQWFKDGVAVPGAVNSVLGLSDLGIDDGGAYQVVVYNGAGAVTSQSAALTILFAAYIFENPQSVSLRGSTNTADYGSTTNRSATFNVVATSSSPLSYQWRFNGTPIPGATGPSLTINNVTLAQDGSYDVVITDAIGPVVSSPARLTVLLNPLFLQLPVNQTIVAGGNVTFSTAISGNPPPFGYSWRRGSAPIAVITDSTDHFNVATVNSTTAGLILLPGITSSNYSCRLVVTNAALITPGINYQFTVTVLADTDGDGLSDDWEQANFGNSTAASPTADPDGDTLLNWEEQVAGTNPKDPASYLKIDALNGGGPRTLTFGAIAGRAYFVQSTEAVAAGPWSTLATLPARTTNWTATIIDPGSGSNRFYRVVTP